MASAAGVVLAGVVVLAGAGPASAAGPVRVDCATADLQDAIDNAPSGTTLIVTGSCTGDFIPFTINKNLSLIGRDTAELSGGLVITGDVTVNLTSLTITGNSEADSVTRKSESVTRAARSGGVFVAYIFISYATRDRVIADELSHWLRAAGHELFLDQRPSRRNQRWGGLEAVPVPGTARGRCSDRCGDVVFCSVELVLG
jgi:hypothetical protein